MQMGRLLSEVAQSNDRHGGLWTRDKILLKLMEEVGELSRAFRKKDRANQAEELGDVLFACLCLALREDIDPVAAILRTIQEADVGDIPDKTDKVLVILRADHGTPKPVVGAMWVPVGRSVSGFQAEVTELRNVLVADSGSYDEQQLISALEIRGYVFVAPPAEIVL